MKRALRQDGFRISGHRSPAGRALAAAVAALAAALTAHAQEAAWSLGGTLTARLFGSASEGAQAWCGSAVTLETTLAADGDVLRAEFSSEASVLAGSAVDALAAAVSSGYIPADTLHAPEDLSSAETALAFRVRTAYAKWNAPAFALTVGRQVVNYGKGAAWSPADIFTEVDYSGLSLVRRGSDAVRLTVPLGPLSRMEAVAAPASDPAGGAYALRLAGLAFDTVDGSLVGAWNGGAEAWVLGGDAKADLSAFSLHAEATVSLPYGGEEFLRALIGFDTSFGDFVLAGEYYYNGGGSDPLFPGTHNVYAALAWEPPGYHGFGASGLWDVEARIFSAQAAWTWDLAQNGEMTAYVKALNGSFPSATREWAAQAGFQFMVSF